MWVGITHVNSRDQKLTVVEMAGKLIKSGKITIGCLVCEITESARTTYCRRIDYGHLQI